MGTRDFDGWKSGSFLNWSLANHQCVFTDVVMKWGVIFVFTQFALYVTLIKFMNVDSWTVSYF